MLPSRTKSLRCEFNNTLQLKRSRTERVPMNSGSRVAIPVEYSARDIFDPNRRNITLTLLSAVFVRSIIYTSKHTLIQYARTITGPDICNLITRLNQLTKCVGERFFKKLSSRHFYLPVASTAITIPVKTVTTKYRNDIAAGSDAIFTASMV